MAAISTVRFVINPTGKGVQTPKWLEATIAGAIPICQTNPAVVTLRNAGWPMVVVDDWEEVASAANRDLWWTELSPVLYAVRARGALTVDGCMRYLTNLRSFSPRVEDAMED